MAIPPNDTSKIITVFKFPNEAPERVQTIPPNSDLYVAKFVAGTVLSVPAASLSSYSGSLLVITEGDVEANGSISVLQAAGHNVTQTKIFTETDHPHFEAADFVPSVTASGTTSGSSPLATPSLGLNQFAGLQLVLFVAIALVVMLIVVVVALMIRRTRRVKSMP